MWLHMVPYHTIAWSMDMYAMGHGMYGPMHWRGRDPTDTCKGLLHGTRHRHTIYALPGENSRSPNLCVITSKNP